MINGRDLAFLKVHSFGTLEQGSIPEDKSWMLSYFAKREIIILLFYLLFWPYFRHQYNYRNVLRKYFIDFIGLRAYPYFFYHTIDKIEYLSNIMAVSQAELDFDTLELLNSGNFQLCYSEKKLTSVEYITFDFAISKYPDAVNAISIKLQNGQSSFKCDPLSSFKWLLVRYKAGGTKICCRKGTKLNYCENINDAGTVPTL